MCSSLTWSRAQGAQGSLQPEGRHWTREIAASGCTVEAEGPASWKQETHRAAKALGTACIQLLVDVMDLPVRTCMHAVLSGSVQNALEED